MKKLISLVLLSAASICPAYAEGPYFGVTYNSMSLDDNRVAGVDFDVDTFGLIGGYHFTPNFALEARLLSGVEDDSSGGFRAEVDSYIGANLLGKLPLSNQFALYGTLGYGFLDTNITGPGLNLNDDDGAVSYGLGVMYTAGSVNIRAGYETLYDDNNVEADGLNLTATFSF